MGLKIPKRPSVRAATFGVASYEQFIALPQRHRSMSESPVPMDHEPAPIPIGEPLAWPLLDQNGTLLLRAGSIVGSEEERRFLIDHFSFYKGVARTGTAENANPGASDARAAPVTLTQMRLAIGAPIGMRSFFATTSPMRRSRLIGFSPDHSLFVTAPRVGKLPLVLSAGENVQAVAIGAHAVYSFSCTVLAACSEPFHYLVLSEPGAVRLLRERKAARVQTRLAVKYRALSTDGEAQGLGLGRDLSVQGMALVSPRVLGAIGAQVQVSFPIRTAQVDTQFEAMAIVRNVKDSVAPDGLVTHGLEFESVSGEQQFALRSFLFDCLSGSAL
ncbi:flagellar brake protein [Trinickia dabaoshanensis]|uniref:Flagellar brake protein n=2 Tax=Trinickia dabaoshanensis TaxID=564714 RepID=A0A2N7VC88_9BURK|nr:flagellar brake protein [Trinickia dabaoshanensis]